MGAYRVIPMVATTPWLGGASISPNVGRAIAFCRLPSLARARLGTGSPDSLGRYTQFPALPLHRVAGRFYVAGVFIGAPLGIYVQYFEERMGGTLNFRAGGEQELLAANPLDAEIFATSAIAAGQLYVRTVSGLDCFGMR